VAPPGLAALLAVGARPGRPPIPVDLQRLIVTMARASPTWGEERIANERLLKPGLAVSPRTVGRYLRHVRPARGGRRSQRWATFVRNHAHAVLACDFFITETARFRVIYVFVVLDVGTRRIVHWNVSEHPTADWTIQQVRIVLTAETSDQFVLHDRDGIYAADVDRAIASMGRRVLETPVRPLDPSRMSDPLQPGSSAYPLGTGDSRPITRAAPARLCRPSRVRTTSSGRDADSERAAPRISLGARGCVIGHNALAFDSYGPQGGARVLRRTVDTVNTQMAMIDRCPAPSLVVDQESWRCGQTVGRFRPRSATGFAGATVVDRSSWTAGGAKLRDPCLSKSITVWYSLHTVTVPVPYCGCETRSPMR
jgi:hypothetical protein